MKLKDYKLIFIAVALIGVLIIAASAIAGFIPAPKSETFSELYLLGPNQMASNYPANVAEGENYSIYVDVTNHLASSAHYVVYIKLANSTDQLPNTTLGTPSPLTPLYEYQFTLQDETVWQTPLNFTITRSTITATTAQINTLQINDKTLNIDKSTVWNSNSSKFPYTLFFELWLFNEQTGSLEFNSRYVSLQLNLTRTS